MEIDTKFSLIDLIINWFVFTPLVVGFWYGTYVLLDVIIFDNLASRSLSTVIILLFGVSIEFSATFWQDEIHKYSNNLSNIHLICFSRGYNYLLAIANICHYRGIQEIFDGWFGAGELSSSIQTAVTSIVLLWSLRASRNITAIPFSVSLDSDHSTWYNAPTLYQCPNDRKYGYLGDVLLTVMVVWSLGPLHWVTLGYVFDNLIFPNDPQLSCIFSCILGYATVATYSYFQFKVQKWSEFYDNAERFISKTLLEDIFIWGATAGVILTWKGIGMAIDMTAREYPLIIFDLDMSGLAANLISFLILSLCYVSASLVGKGAEMDGSVAKGDGVDFSRAYLRHFFNDYIQNQKKQQTEGEKTKSE